MKPTILGLLCVALLVGCTPTPEPVPTTDSTPEPSVTVEATDEPVVSTEPPAVSELIVSPEGLGPILFGVPYTATGDASPIVWDETYCNFEDSPDTAGLEDYPGWKPVYPDFPFIVSVDEFTPDLPVRYILVWSPEILTAEGIGLGSTLSEVQAAYGSQLIDIPNEFYPGYAINGSRGQLVFWMDAGSATASPTDVVNLMTVEEQSTNTTMPLEGPCY